MHRPLDMCISNLRYHSDGVGQIGKLRSKVDRRTRTFQTLIPSVPATCPSLFFYVIFVVSCRKSSLVISISTHACIALHLDSVVIAPSMFGYSSWDSAIISTRMLP